MKHKHFDKNQKLQIFQVYQTARTIGSRRPKNAMLKTESHRWTKRDAQMPTTTFHTCSDEEGRWRANGLLRDYDQLVPWTCGLLDHCVCVANQKAVGYLSPLSSSEIDLVCNREMRLYLLDLQWRIINQTASKPWAAGSNLSKVVSPPEILLRVPGNS